MSSNPPTTQAIEQVPTTLIPVPALDTRIDAQFAADIIALITGNLTTALCSTYIASLQLLSAQIAAGLLSSPICPELTNANPSSPHTVIIEAVAWALQQQAYLINQWPVRDQIEFANLFPSGLKLATAAVTTLTFTVAPPPDTAVDIPAGTQVSTADGSITFATNVDLNIPYGTGSASVAATAIAAGQVILAPGQLVSMTDDIAWVETVANASAIDSGTNQETTQSALARAVAYQQRAERLVSTADIEDAIFNEVLQGSGIVKVVPFAAASNFTLSAPGYSTAIVATSTGAALDPTTKALINGLLCQCIGNQWISVCDPFYVPFSVGVTVALKSGANSQAVLQAINTALTNAYAPSDQTFGMPILREQVITIIQSVPGVVRIVSTQSGPILASPLIDTVLQPWQMPQLNQPVSITVQ
ncbi:MAG TPA: baseplate J/gp47 family protein [Blastocatellia bacterium]